VAENAEPGKWRNLYSWKTQDPIIGMHICKYYFNQQQSQTKQLRINAEKNDKKQWMLIARRENAVPGKFP